MGGGKTQVVSAPAAPNYQESMRSILEAQVSMAPQVYASEAQYQPKYQALQDQIAKQAAESQIALYRGLQPSYSALEEDYMKSQQAAQLRGLQERAPGYVQAFQEAQGVGGINQALQQYTQQKLAGLQADGTNISPQEQRAIEQQTRAGYAARGTALGGQSNLAEVLNRYNARQAREQQLLAWARSTVLTILKCNMPLGWLRLMPQGQQARVQCGDQLLAADWAHLDH